MTDKEETKEIVKIKPLTEKEERFCQLYAKDELISENATLCYASAYGYDLEELKKSNMIEYEKAYKVCGVNGCINIGKDDIWNRICEIGAAGLQPNYLDYKLKRLIDKSDDSNKLGAIREANKVKGRIIDKLDVSKYTEVLSNSKKEYE